MTESQSFICIQLQKRQQKNKRIIWSTAHRGCRHQKLLTEICRKSKFTVLQYLLKQ